MCDCVNNMTEQLKKMNPDMENIYAPKELCSGRLYLNFTGKRVVKGKQKDVKIPILLSKCPFCGEKYPEFKD